MAWRGGVARNLVVAWTCLAATGCRPGYDGSKPYSVNPTLVKVHDRGPDGGHWRASGEPPYMTLVVNCPGPDGGVSSTTLGSTYEATLTQYEHDACSASGDDWIKQGITFSITGDTDQDGGFIQIQPPTT